MTFNKIKNYLLLVSVIVIAIMGTFLYQGKKEENRKYELFLNHFYSELTMTILSIDAVLSLDTEARTKEDLIENLYRIEKQMERTGLQLEAGRHLLNNEIQTEIIYFNQNRGIHHFGDDGEIDDTEMEYLTEFRNELELIRQGMYSEETGQENPNLTIEQFNEIIIEATNNSPLLFN